MNSHCEYQRKCLRKSMENLDTDIRVFNIKIEIRDEV